MRILPLTLIALIATPALASSEDAWEEFRADVETACTELVAAEAEPGETVIEVNPFGSESYGVALIIHTLSDESADRYICVYDKKSKKAELSAAFNRPEQVSQLTTDSTGNVEAMPGETTDAHLAGE